MFYLENNTTFSGSDIKVYVYKNITDFQDFKDRDKKRALKNVENSLYGDDPFSDFEPSELDQKLDESLQGMASERPTVYPQNTINYPDGKKEVVDETRVQDILNFNSAPRVKTFPEEYIANFGDEGVTTYKGLNGRLDLDEVIAERQAINDENEYYEAVDGLEPGALGRQVVPEVLELEPQAEIKYKGETQIIPARDAYEIAENHIDPEVSSAPPSIDYDAVQTNKVNPNFIDVVKRGSDKKALELARKYQLAKVNRNKNTISYTEDNSEKTKSKPIIELGSLYSITYSSFREKHAIRTLGRVSAVNYTRGQRTIAGSMNFTVFQSHELMDFLRPEGLERDKVVILDQLPKFNLMLLMINEYGGASILHLFGVTISTESQQTSVEDLALMNNVTFYAEDIMTIENVGNAFETSLSMLHPTIIAERTLKFYKKNEYTTLDGMLQSYSDYTNEEGNGTKSKLKGLISRSRGLF